MLRSFVTVVITVVLVACGSSPQDETLPGFPTQPPSEQRTTTLTLPSTQPTPTPTATTSQDAVLLAVGDIASCTTTTDERVARMLRRRSAPVALLGDIVYPSGTAQQYRDCFDPAWGAMRDRLHPVPGNHDYQTAGAAGYFAYWEQRAGTSGRGWYTFDLGQHWRIIALNSQCSAVGGCTAKSPQGRWLRRTLDAAGDRHVLAFWHSPRFNSGHHGNDLATAPLWKALYRAGADIVLNGHEHVYERFAPQNPDGRRAADGIRQFTVGTGGYTHYRFRGPPLRTTQVRDNTSFGVLRLRLEPDGYRWRFIPATGEFTDRGSHRLP